jgi:CHAD domain-containing protein
VTGRTAAHDTAANVTAANDNGSVTESFVERELKFDVDPEFAVPDLAPILPAGGTAVAGSEQLRSEYHDTDDLALQSVHMTLRRRTGSTDTGWQLKVPRPPFRSEIRVDEVSDEVPPQLADLLVAVCGREPLRRLATLTTDRSTLRLLDGTGTPLAEVDDDRVTAVVDAEPASTMSWREVEVELAGEDVDLLRRIGTFLEESGARVSASPSKLGRALRSAGLSVEGPTELTTAGDVVAAYVAEQRRIMVAGDVALRRGDDSVIHQTRVATRRLRGALRTFAVLFDEKRASALDDELRWLAGLMGEIRDRQVLDRRLEAMVAALDDTIVLGPVRARIRGELGRERSTYWSRLQEELVGERYFALVAELADWVRQPPSTPDARQPAAIVVDMVDRVRRKVSRRLDRANESGDPTDLHSTRKAAKRARYAAEAVAPVIGETASDKLASRYEKLQDLLGEHQDSLISAGVLRRLGAAAGETPGENGFTFGILREQEEHNARVARKKARKRAATYR